MSHVIGFLLLTWETWVAFFLLAPTPALPVVGIWGMNEVAKSSLSLFLPLK